MELREAGSDVLLPVRVQPGTSNPGVAWHGDVLVVRVAAPPVDGRATEEARRLLARSLGLRRAAVTLESGARARDKVFRIANLAARDLAARLPGRA